MSSILRTQQRARSEWFRRLVELPSGTEIPAWAKQGSTSPRIGVAQLPSLAEQRRANRLAARGQVKTDAGRSTEVAKPSILRRMAGAVGKLFRRGAARSR